MDYQPESDQVEKQAQEYDAGDLDARIGQAENVKTTEATEAPAQDVQQLEQRVQQLRAETKAREAKEMAELKAAEPAGPQEPVQKPEPPPEYQPASASGEKGLADREETGPEKPEVKYFHSGGPESGE